MGMLKNSNNNWLPIIMGMLKNSNNNGLSIFRDVLKIANIYGRVNNCNNYGQVKKLQ